MKALFVRLPLALLMACAILVFAGCDSGGPDIEEPPVTAGADTVAIRDVQYVNKTIHRSHLGVSQPSEYVYAMDLAVTFDTLVNLDEIRRLVIYGESAGRSVGWDLSTRDLTDAELRDSVLTIPNLLLFYRDGLVNDELFRITAHLTNGTSSEYEFVHNQWFGQPLVTRASWFSREALGIELQQQSWEPRPYIADGGLVVWTSGTTVIDSTVVTAEQFDASGTVMLNDVPEAATSYYVEVEGAVNGAEMQSISALAVIPERIPLNTSFVEGIVLGDQLTTASQGSTFYILGQLDHKLYAVDAATSAIRATLNTRPFTAVIATGADEVVYLGYADGAVEEWLPGTGGVRRVATLGSPIISMVTADGRLVVGHTENNNSVLSVVNLSTGAVVNQVQQWWYTPAAMVYNAANSRIYFTRYGISPDDVHSFNLDASGAISDVRESRYHGDYPILPPLFVLPSGGHILTGAGTVFTSSSNVEEDIVYQGKFAYWTMDAVMFEPQDRLVALRDIGYYNPPSAFMDVYRLSDREFVKEVLLPGRPPPPRKYIH